MTTTTTPLSPSALAALGDIARRDPIVSTRIVKALNDAGVPTELWTIRFLEGLEQVALATGLQMQAAVVGPTQYMLPETGDHFIRAAKRVLFP